MNRVDPPSPFGHKIRPRHRDRLAVVYIRQSTPQQVVNNRESADLQYQLRQRAVALGWADDRVLVIDDDHATRSGATGRGGDPLAWRREHTPRDPSGSADVHRPRN